MSVTRTVRLHCHLTVSFHFLLLFQWFWQKIWRPITLVIGGTLGSRRSSGLGDDRWGSRNRCVSERCLGKKGQAWRVIDLCLALLVWGALRSRTYAVIFKCHVWSSDRKFISLYFVLKTDYNTILPTQIYSRGNLDWYTPVNLSVFVPSAAGFFFLLI